MHDQYKKNQNQISKTKEQIRKCHKLITILKIPERKDFWNKVSKNEFKRTLNALGYWKWLLRKVSRATLLPIEHCENGFGEMSDDEGHNAWHSSEEKNHEHIVGLIVRKTGQSRQLYTHFRKYFLLIFDRLHTVTIIQIHTLISTHEDDLVIISEFNDRSGYFAITGRKSKHIRRRRSKWQGSRTKTWAITLTLANPASPQYVVDESLELSRWFVA